MPKGSKQKAPHIHSGLKDYGMEFKVKPSNQLEIEMRGFAKDWDGKKAEFFKRIAAIAYPWVKWHDWAELCLWAWCNYNELSAGGCAAGGKTFMFSWLGSMEFFCSPHNTAVILTSSTVPSLRTRLWPRVKDFHMLTLPTGNGQWVKAPLPYHILDSKTMIQKEKGDDEHAIRAVAVDSGPVEQAIGKIIGAHPGRVIIVVDEAAQTKPAIFEARSNLSVGTTFYRFVALSNPVSQFDAHGKFCEPKRGWSTISVEDQWWETKTGVCLHFDGLKSPNVLAGEEKYPKLFGLADIDRIRMQSDGREDTLRWWSQVRGFWPPSGISNTVLDASTIIAGRARDKVTWERGYKTIASLDPAFTTGGDDCVLRFFQVGNFADGVPGMFLSEIINIQLSLSTGVPINYQIADRVKEECEARGVKPEDFTGDSTAASGLFDIISQRWSSQIRRVSFGGKATERPVGYGDERPASQVYRNRVTELWFSFKKMVAHGRIRGLDDKTAQEFCTRQFKLEGERSVVEPKSEMKLRTNGSSPDCFIAGTLVSTPFGDIPIEELNPGDVVLTPFGESRIFANHCNETAELTSVKFGNGGTLSGRPKHRCFVKGSGWARLDSLSLDSDLESVHDRWKWIILNSCFTRVVNTGFKALADIIKTDQRMSRSDFFTGLSGSKTSARFLKACASITRMVTGLITDQKTWNCTPSQATCGFMGKSGGMERQGMTLTQCGSVSEKPEMQHGNGTAARLESNGTPRQPRQHSTSGFTSAFVKSAERASRPIQYGSQFTARMCALESLTQRLLKTAKSAAQNLLRASIGRLDFVVRDVRTSVLGESVKVYNLTLCEEQAYYANGVLVDNCADPCALAADYFRDLYGENGGKVEETNIEVEVNFKALAKRFASIHHKNVYAA